MTAISVSERLLEMAAFYTPLALTVTLLSLFSLYSEVRITPHHENGLLHLHLGWCSIFPSETAETLAAARVSGVESFSATLVGPSGETRTPGILLPKRFSAFFIVVYSNL